MNDTTDDILIPEGFMPQVKVAKHYRVSEAAQFEVNRLPNRIVPYPSGPFRAANAQRPENVKRQPRRRAAQLRSATMQRGSTIGMGRTMKVLGVSRAELMELERTGQLVSWRPGPGLREFVFADVFRLVRRGMPEIPVPALCRSTLPIHRCGPIYTYFVQSVAGGLVKIGITNNIQKRLVGLQNSCPIPLACLGIIDGDREEHLHVRFAHLRQHGEWFEPAPELLEYVRQNARRA